MEGLTLLGKRLLKEWNRNFQTFLGTGVITRFGGGGGSKKCERCGVAYVGGEDRCEGRGNKFVGA